MSDNNERIEPGNMHFAFRRLMRNLQEHQQKAARTALTTSAAQITNDVGAQVDMHANAAQFVHGVGPLFVAKTRNPGQYVRWDEIVGRPGLGEIGVDISSLELDASQITSGVLDYLRIPFAAHGANTPNTAVRADDPRLSTQFITMLAAEPLTAGDFVTIADPDPALSHCKQALATSYASSAIGFVTANYGPGDLATVFPLGENVFVLLPGADVDDLGKTVFLSATNPGKVSLTPPSATGLILQPLGTVSRIVSGSLVAVMTRYEFRLRL